MLGKGRELPGARNSPLAYAGLDPGCLPVSLPFPLPTAISSKPQPPNKSVQARETPEHLAEPEGSLAGPLGLCPPGP